MSKLIAFRLPDDRVGPFDEWCAKNGKTATAALVQAVDELLNPMLPIPDKPIKTLRQGDIAATRIRTAAEVKIREVYVQLGPTPSPAGSRLKSSKR